MPAYANVTYGGIMNGGLAMDLSIPFIIVLLLLGITIGIVLYESVYQKAKKGIKLLIGLGFFIVFGFISEFIFKIAYELIKFFTKVAGYYTLQDFINLGLSLLYYLLFGYLVYWVLKKLYYRMDRAGDLDFLKDEKEVAKSG